MSDVYYLAQVLLNFTGVRTFWGYCLQDDEGSSQAPTQQKKTEIFHHLFGEQPLEQFTRNTTTQLGQYVRITNNCPAFRHFFRYGRGDAGPDPHKPCPCSFDKAKHDAVFYHDLRRRFIRREQVERFAQTHFHASSSSSHQQQQQRNLGGGDAASNNDGKDVTTIGVHIRAGNGESGDFQVKNRGIQQEDVWLRNVVDLIVRQQREKRQLSGWAPRLKFFVATDTPTMIDKLKTVVAAVNHDNAAADATTTTTIIDVIAYEEQDRPEHGSGVLFGARGKVLSRGNKCLKGWEDTFTDMFLLTHTDVVVAARPSSYTQSLPMSIQLAKAATAAKSSSPVRQRYCELDWNATDMRCYATFEEWCCNGSSRFMYSGTHKAKEYEYLLQPPETGAAAIIGHKKIRIINRTQQVDSYGNSMDCVPPPMVNQKLRCIPYDWSPYT